MDSLKTIAVLGAGFGGLRAALVLSKKLKRLGLHKKYEVILIDRNDHHTYTPLLYEVATISKETANLHVVHEVAAYKINSIIESWGVRFIEGNITSLDLVNGIVCLDKKKIKAEYCVVALGSEPNYFNIPGLQEYALPFKTFKDAIAVRNAVWNSALTGTSDIRVVIGGAGPTGVELAGELNVWAGELERELGGERLEVTLVETGATILPHFAAKIIEKVVRRLSRLGVQIMTGEKISSVGKSEVKLVSGKTVPFEIFVWTGGVKAPSLISHLPLQEELNRVKVVGEMECLPQSPSLRLHSRIYAIGDSVCFYNPVTKEPIPGVARAAISQANIAAHNIVEEIKVAKKIIKTPRPKVYTPMDYPYIIPVGGKFAVAKIGPLVINGFFGWVLKGLVELNYLLSIMPLTHALKIWAKALKVFAQNDRLG